MSNLLFDWENNTNSLITLFHGTNNVDMVPTFGLGRNTCDFGSGFYATEDIELTKEWSQNNV